MKKTALLISALLVVLSCSYRHGKAGNVRTMEDIFDEVVEAASYTTRDQFSVRRTTALFNELADTLCSVMVNSDLTDTDTRIIAQQIAGYAIFLAAEYGEEAGADLEQCIDKYSQAMSTWRTLMTDSGPAYVKEISYNIRKDTEFEEARTMFVIASTTEDAQCMIMLPQEAVSAYVIFAGKLEGDFGYDTENALFLGGGDGFLNEEDEQMLYLFEPQEFMDALAAYDAMFIYYTEEDGTRESAMVRLEALHDQVRRPSGHGNSLQGL